MTTQENQVLRELYEKTDVEYSRLLDTGRNTLTGRRIYFAQRKGLLGGRYVTLNKDGSLRSHKQFADALFD